MSDNNCKEKLKDCRFLIINAVDEYEMGLRDVTIDLKTNKIVAGVVTLYDNGCATESIRVADLKNYGDLKKIHLFLKVCDRGEYVLADCDKLPMFKLFGYVPDLFDFINKEDGFGDYIDILVNNDCTIHNNIISDEVSIYDKMMSSPDEKMPVGNGPEHWEYCHEGKVLNEPQDYNRGYNDGLTRALEIVSECYAEIESLIKKR